MSIPLLDDFFDEGLDLIFVLSVELLAIGLKTFDALLVNLIHSQATDCLQPEVVIRLLLVCKLGFQVVMSCVDINVHHEFTQRGHEGSVVEVVRALPSIERVLPSSY